MTLYRPHRGSLAHAMAEVVTVNGFDDLVEHMRATCPELLSARQNADGGKHQIAPYGFDKRIDRIVRGPG